MRQLLPSAATPTSERAHAVASVLLTPFPPRRLALVFRFVIVKLKPLTTSQQSSAVSSQLKGYKAAENLMGFSDIRSNHNLLFKEAFTAQEREIMESIERLDLFLWADPPENAHKDPAETPPVAFDPSFRIWVKPEGAKDARIAKKKTASGHLTSSTLLAANTALSDFLDAFDAELKKHEAKDASAQQHGLDEAKVEQALWQVAPQGLADHHWKLAKKLGLFHQKAKTSADFKKQVEDLSEYKVERPNDQMSLRQVWNIILTRTDEVFSVNERLFETYKKAMRALIEELDIGTGRPLDPDYKYGADDASAVLEKLGLSKDKRSKELEDALTEYVTTEEKQIQVLTLGELKDPVRVHEKAIDDYFRRFVDEGVAEACVVDILRGRAVLQQATAITTLVQKLTRARGAPLTFRDKDLFGVELELVRVKNKFYPGNLDPSRFRNLLLNLKIRDTRCGIECFCELQLHHADILLWNTLSHAHDNYDFFRRDLSNNYERQLGESLGRVLEFLEEIGGVPVLLSLLVLVFGADKGSGTNEWLKGLPMTRATLYERAVQAALETALREASPSVQADVPKIKTMLCKIAISNHLVADGSAGKREFSMSDVKAVLDAHEVKLWNQFLPQPDVDADEKKEKGVPLIKTVFLSPDQVGEGSRFQFKHLSFQEALFAQGLIDTLKGKNRAKMKEAFVESLDSFVVNYLGNPWYLNCLRIGAGPLGTALADEICESWELESLMQALAFKEQKPLRALSYVLHGNEKLKKLVLRGTTIPSGEEIGSVAVAISNCSLLKELNVQDLKPASAVKEIGQELLQSTNHKCAALTRTLTSDATAEPCLHIS